MSSTTATTSARSDAPLRARLRHNAIFSATGGAVATIGCVPLADLLGVDQWWLVLGVGVGLLGFAALVWWAASRPPAALVGDALEISLADLAWVAVSVVTIALGWYSTAGATVIAAQAAVVAFMGVTQLTRRHHVVG